MKIWILSNNAVVGLYRRTLVSTCTKTQVADKKASFLRLSKLGKCEFTVVNDHFESKSNKKMEFSC